ncbi:MAG: BolA family protein [Porticoccaceae bacterium]
MSPDEVTQLLRQKLADCQITVQTEGGHFNIQAIGDIFEGKRPVQRQQLIYAALREQIASGAIHAVNMKTYTQREWQQQA